MLCLSYGLMLGVAVWYTRTSILNLMNVVSD
jgi:hypothetical protein